MDKKVKDFFDDFKFMIMSAITVSFNKSLFQLPRIHLFLWCGIGVFNLLSLRLNVVCGSFSRFRDGSKCWWNLLRVKLPPFLGSRWLLHTHFNVERWSQKSWMSIFLSLIWLDWEQNPRVFVKYPMHVPGQEIAASNNNNNNNNCSNWNLIPPEITPTSADAPDWRAVVTFK